jgi:hypothetical protein
VKARNGSRFGTRVSHFVTTYVGVGLDPRKVVCKTKSNGSPDKAFNDRDVPVRGAFVGNPVDCHKNATRVRMNNSFLNFCS